MQIIIKKAYIDCQQSFKFPYQKIIKYSVFMQIYIDYSYNNFESMNRSTTNDPQILVVSLNYKGITQVIRLLLCYLKLPFLDIYVDQYQTQKQTLPAKIRQLVEQHPVNKADLPAIIHDGQVIYQLNQIMTYICRAYERQDLLGADLHQKTQVCQIMQIYSQKIMPSIIFLTNYVMEAFKCPHKGNQFLSFIQSKYLQLLKTSGYIMELAIYLIKQEFPKFVYGNITVVDFFYAEGARHTLSLFGAIDYQSASPRWSEIGQKYLAYKKQKGQNIQKVQILRAIKQYLQFFASQQFYLQNQEYLQSFKVFPKTMPETLLIGMKKLWAIEQKHLHY